MKRKQLVAAAALALGLGVSACGQGVSSEGGGSGETYTWDMTITTGKNSTWHEGAELFAETVREESGGRMNVNIFTNEQLSSGDTVAGLEQLMDGEKALGYYSTIIYASLDPRFGAINAPFLYSDFEEAEQAIEGGALEAYEELAASKDVKLLGFGESGFRQLTNNVRAIEEPADLEGIKFRIPGIGLFTDAFKLMDANPTTMAFSEVFTSLQQGTIEGQENPVDIIYSFDLQEVQKYLTVWNYVYDPLILGMNKDVFDSMSAEDQQIVLDAAAKANEVQIESNREKEAGELEELSGAMEVTELSAEQTDAFREAMAPLYDKYQSIWGPDVADAVRPE